MTPSINTVMDVGAWVMLIILSMLWGGSFFFVGVVVSDLPPLTIVTLRVGLAALALLRKVELPVTVPRKTVRSPSK